MKLVLFNDNVPGSISGERIVDLSDAVGDSVMRVPGVYRMQAIIEQWDTLKAPVEEATKRAAHIATNYKLRPPVPRPSKMAFGRDMYRDGLEKKYCSPINFFFKLPNSIIGPDEDVVLPPDDAQLFFHEAELAFVISKRAKNVPAEKAMDYVFGYTCVNDISSWGLPGVIGGLEGKSFDTWCPMGPCIATKDEIPDPHNLQIRLWIDDLIYQDYSTSDLAYSIPELIAWLSAKITLEPGDILTCGSNHWGIGAIQNGQTMRMEIDGIGSLVSGVVDPLNRKWPVGPDDYWVNWVRKRKMTGEAEGPPFLIKRIA